MTRILHVPENTLPEYKRLKLEKLRQIDDELAGCKVLIVDDDVRNIFALTSILERHNVEVLHAENGRAGIDTLLQTPDVDIVLMDIMMPGMDGYETIRAVRELDALRNLPIIAVTAKAMKGDREKCIDSGASDYIAKPVDLDQLFSLMRVWMYERRQKAAGARSTV
jgi:CheY-like chemotaxis protein